MQERQGMYVSNSLAGHCPSGCSLVGYAPSGASPSTQECIIGGVVTGAR